MHSRKSLDDLDSICLEEICLYLPKENNLVLRAVNKKLKSKIDTSTLLWENKRLLVRLSDNKDLVNFIQYANHNINFKKFSSILIINKSELNNRIYLNRTITSHRPLWLCFKYLSVGNMGFLNLFSKNCTELLIDHFVCSNRALRLDNISFFDKITTAKITFNFEFNASTIQYDIFLHKFWCDQFARAFLFKKSNLKVLSLSNYSGGAVLLFKLLDNLNLERLELVDISYAVDLQSVVRCYFSANEVILKEVNKEYLVMIIKVFINLHNVEKCTVFFGDGELENDELEVLKIIQLRMNNLKFFNCDSTDLFCIRLNENVTEVIVSHYTHNYQFIIDFIGQSIPNSVILATATFYIFIEDERDFQGFLNLTLFICSSNLKIKKLNIRICLGKSVRLQVFKDYLETNGLFIDAESKNLAVHSEINRNCCEISIMFTENERDFV